MSIDERHSHILGFEGQTEKKSSQGGGILQTGGFLTVI